MMRLFSLILFLLMMSLPLFAQEQAVQNPSKLNQNSFQETTTPSDANVVKIPSQEDKAVVTKEDAQRTYRFGETDDAYTLGAHDSIGILVQGHPELSGTFPLNSEGNIQYEFAGDVGLGGMTKSAAEDKLREVLSKYVVSPKLIVKVVEYNSKAVYVIGQVANPGKYYMRSERIPVREAVIEAGMPIPGSAMHRTRLITHAQNGDPEIKIVDLNALFQRGDMQNNLEMNSGDQLFIPSTQEEMESIQAKNENSIALARVDAAAPKLEDTIGSGLEAATMPESEEVLYTLGPDDVVEITVQKHPEVSGTYPINSEGKIQMNMVGDIYVNGLSKKELKEKITKLINGYVDNPDVNVTIIDYRSKVYYVIGEVGSPGKYYMRSDSILVREAVIEAGLPTLAAAMRKCRLITPAKNGKTRTQRVNLYELLYGGDLDKNPEMRPGDFLYVPSTVMAKVMRVIAPVSEPVTSAASAQSGVGTLGSNPLPKR